MYYYFIENHIDVFEREEEVNINEYPQFIKLTDDQVEYYLAHPYAKRYEIEHHNVSPTLEEVKAKKIRHLEVYDKSSNVNIFYIDDEPCWLDKTTRSSLNYTIEVEESKGSGSIDLWYGVNRYTLPIQDAKVMLAALESYAYSCFNVTANHRANIYDLTTVEEVNNYNYEVGYPEKLHFTSINNQ